MKRLSVYLKYYRKECILAPLFKMLEALFDLFVPLVIAALIDRGIGEGKTQLILSNALLLLLLAGIGLACSITAQFFAARASVGFASRLRQALFDHIQALSYQKLDELGTDTMITRMTSDINQIQNGLNLALRLLLRSPFIVFGAMIMAFYVDVKSALTFAAVLPLLCLVVFGIMLVSIPLYKKVQAALDRVTAATRENLTGVRVIRAFGKEEQETEEFDRKNEMLTVLQKYVGRLSAMMNPLTFVLINAATIFLIYIGALQVNSGVLTQGSIVALYNYMAQILVELVKLANLIINITRALACAGRVGTVLETENDMAYPQEENHTAANIRPDSAASDRADQTDNPENTGKPKAPAVEFEHVSFTYSGAAESSLCDISLTARKGEMIGIIGGTGSGKTTLISLIPRFYDASLGRVLVDGTDVKAYPKGELIRRIAVVPQKAVLFRGTIRDNMKMGREDAEDEEILEALEAAQAMEIVNGKPDGLEYMLEQNGRNLSGGQRQRLTIARALLMKPEILILDDSASALDQVTDAALRRALREKQGDMTIFVISQRACGVRDADQILVLEDGETAGVGTHAQLLANCSVYQEIYYSQYPEEKKPEVTV